ncbi:PucR family transcriptional regulator [Streptomyces sp. NPDC058052]|uniref:PucR family transcriptional regulator n=1 Tax=Streptomyces sp. NPDC058052 TaxID=3346316 RepID=UPI0036E39892
MDRPWPEPTPRVRRLFRHAAEIALAPLPEWVEELNRASLGGVGMRPVRDDPVLADRIRDSTLANITHWAAANVQYPGRRVPANLGPEMLETARDLVRRGFDETALEAYRTGQGAAWRRWMEICFGLTSRIDELRELLDLSSRSITAFIDDTIAAITARMAAERQELTRGTHAERRAVITLILEGAPIGRAQAEARLGYALTGPHLAAVVWGPAAARADHLERAADTLVRTGTGGAGGRLTVVASAGALWVWIPTAVAPGVRAVTERLAALPDVRIALGRPGHDLDGFRRSHLDALAAQRMMARLNSPQQVARHEDVQLVALMTQDLALADEFVEDVLGDLAEADAQTRDAVLAYVDEQFNTSRTARRLLTHRNTVLRRLARADELLPKPLAENPLHVAAALNVLRWREPRAR